ncbi:unnamed protein product [Hyaloperonospora brassicae]|uniref:Protein kinase domain-containing protein n=1 Tax=Hyaloperonospora brassicae TaxID=162125 RepID=A0AAV0T1U8_HYABA|nr:unnamed protein product [Hyaloperonospora brassicae]
MGFLAFLTCGSCSSRRKRGHEHFPDTITLPTASSTQPHRPTGARAYAPHPTASHGTTGSAAAAATSGGDPRSRGSTVDGSHARPSSGPHRLPSRELHAAEQEGRASSSSQLPPPKYVATGQLSGGGSGHSSGNNRDADITDKSRQVANRVLEQFQADPTLGRRRIPYASLYFTRVLSKGAFGEVWLAQLENQQVAVKRILNEKKNDVREIECFGAEIKLMASFSHPKIVEFVGISWSSMQDVCAVTEYMSKGDLYGFLKRRQGQLNWRDHRIYLAEDVADALGYLHGLSPKVIHRDLKSKNILLDDSFRAKLSDFGISRERSVEDTMTAGVGTIYWTAPEVLMGKKYTEKADIFSFGIVMSELDMHVVPYSDKRDSAGKKLQGMKIVQMVIRRNLRPTFSPECPPLVKELVDRCLDADPDVRPSAVELLRIIQRMQSHL